VTLKVKTLEIQIIEVLGSKKIKGFKHLREENLSFREQETQRV
jgi:hypothetical protein